MEVPYTTVINVPGPHVTVTMVFSGKEFIGRVDSGADISIVPESCISNEKPIGSTVIRMSSGSKKRMHTYEVYIIVAGKVISLPEVGTTTSDVGFLGMDTINQFDVLLSGGVLIIE